MKTGLFVLAVLVASGCSSNGYYDDYWYDDGYYYGEDYYGGYYDDGYGYEYRELSPQAAFLSSRVGASTDTRVPAEGAGSLERYPGSNACPEWSWVALVPAGQVGMEVELDIQGNLERLEKGVEVDMGELWQSGLYAEGWVFDESGAQYDIAATHLRVDVPAEAVTDRVYTWTHDLYDGSTLEATYRLEDVAEAATPTLQRVSGVELRRLDEAQLTEQPGFHAPLRTVTR